MGIQSRFPIAKSYSDNKKHLFHALHRSPCYRTGQSKQVVTESPKKDKMKKFKKMLFVTSTAALFTVGVTGCDKKKAEDTVPKAEEAAAAMDEKVDAHKEAAAKGADAEAHADAAAKEVEAHAEEAKAKKSDHPSGDHPN